MVDDCLFSASVAPSTNRSHIKCSRAVVRQRLGETSLYNFVHTIFANFRSSGLRSGYRVPAIIVDLERCVKVRVVIDAHKSPVYIIMFTNSSYYIIM